MTYPPKGRTAATQAWLERGEGALSSSGGLELPRDQQRRHARPLPRARGDASPPSIGPAPTSTATATRRAQGVGTLDDCAMRVAGDGGIAADRRPRHPRCRLEDAVVRHAGLADYGHIVEYPQLVIEKFSEEHGHVDCSRQQRPAADRRAGDRHPEPCLRRQQPVRHGLRRARRPGGTGARVAARGLVQ